MSTPTVKIVAEVAPDMKLALVLKAREQGITQRAAIEAALTAWIKA